MDLSNYSRNIDDFQSIEDFLTIRQFEDVRQYLKRNELFGNPKIVLKLGADSYRNSVDFIPHKYLHEINNYFDFFFGNTGIFIITL